MVRTALLSLLCFPAIACAAGPGRMYASKAAMAPMTPATSGGTVAADQSTMAIPEQLVIEGSVSLQVEEINDLVPSLHAFVDGAGGRIINEAVSGAATSWNAQLKIRIPPGKVEELVAFLGKKGEILDKRINAQDVSKQMFDQDLAIKNLRTTLDRLTALMRPARPPARSPRRPPRTARPAPPPETEPSSRPFPRAPR